MHMLTLSVATNKKGSAVVTRQEMGIVLEFVAPRCLSAIMWHVLAGYMRVVRGQPCLAGLVEPDCGMWWMASWLYVGAAQSLGICQTRSLPHIFMQHTQCQSRLRATLKITATPPFSTPCFSNCGPCSI